MSGRTLITLGVGVLAAGAVVASGGSAYFALAAFSVGASVAGLMIGPDKQSGVDPDEMEVPTSTEDVTCPLIFGTSRVSQQYIKVNEDELEAIAVTQESSGAKGGGNQPATGHNYRIPLSYGICVGRIDRLWKIVAAPEYDVYAEFDGGLEFTGSQSETFKIEYTESSEDREYTEGGTAVFYSGDSEQGSDGATTDVNHRGFCWVDFPSYFMTGNPNPTTLLFEITRMPEVLDDEGTPVVGFQYRASTNEEHDEYWDANPAAIAWEILRNKLWGRGMPASELDADSFVAASIYYAQARLGVSTAITRTTATEFLERLRQVFGLVVWFDGERMRAKCIWDRTEAYADRIRITHEDTIGSPTFSRESLSNTSNELRITFLNREADYETELATAQDLASIETIGAVKSTSMNANEIGTRRAAELICHAKLRETAYPRATMEIRVRRPYSGLQPTSFVEFITDEWRENKDVTTFWQVIDIEDDDQGQDGITITMAEDLYATAVDGVSDDFQTPIVSIDYDIPLTFSDLNDGYTGPREVGNLEPVITWEPNSWITQGARAILVAPTREKLHVQSASVAWSKTGELETTSLGATTALPITGKLVADLSAGARMLRNQAIQIELTHDTDAAKFENATGAVIDDTDDFTELTKSNEAILLIGNEVMRVGYAEETATGIITIRTLMRGELGTEIEEHEAEDEIAFFPTFAASQLLAASTVPKTTAVDLYIKGNSAYADTEPETIVVPGLGGVFFNGRSQAPPPPELVSAEADGDEWTIRLRPRVFGAGAGYKSLIAEDIANQVTDLSGYSLKIWKSGEAESAIVPAGTSYTTPPYSMPGTVSIDSLKWTPDDGGEDEGIIEIVVTFFGSPPIAKVAMIYAGNESETPTNINQPE